MENNIETILNYKLIGFETEYDQVIMELYTDTPNNFIDCDIQYSKGFRSERTSLKDLKATKETKKLIKEFIKNKTWIEYVTALQVKETIGFDKGFSITCFDEN